MAGETKVDNYMPLFCADFLTGTLGWSATERGHYIALLCVQWTNGSVPADMKSLERISEGVSKCWGRVGEKFQTGEDGKLRNARLEEHRAKAIAIKRKKSEAGREGNRTRWAGRTTVADGSRCDSQTDRGAIANGIAKASPLSLSLSSPTEKETGSRAPTAGDDEFRRPGWVHDEWEAIAAVWNATERARPWQAIGPPNGFVDLAASPGWLESCRQGMAMLPECARFEEPVPWTQFVRELDRILAGEHRKRWEPKGDGSGRHKNPQPKRGNMR